MHEYTIHYNNNLSGLIKVYCYYARRSPSRFLKYVDKIWRILATVALILTSLLAFFRLQRYYSDYANFNFDICLHCLTPLLMALFLIICYIIVRYFFYPLRNYYFEKFITKKTNSLYDSLFNIGITFHENGGYVFSLSIPNNALTFLYSDYKTIYFKKNKLIMLPNNTKKIPTIYIPSCYFTDAAQTSLNKWFGKHK